MVTLKDKMALIEEAEENRKRREAESNNRIAILQKAQEEQKLGAGSKLVQVRNFWSRFVAVTLSKIVYYCI